MVQRHGLLCSPCSPWSLLRLRLPACLSILAFLYLGGWIAKRDASSDCMKVTDKQQQQASYFIMAHMSHNAPRGLRLIISPRMDTSLRPPMSWAAAEQPVTVVSRLIANSTTRYPDLPPVHSACNG